MTRGEIAKAAYTLRELADLSAKALRKEGVDLGNRSFSMIAVSEVDLRCFQDVSALLFEIAMADSETEPDESGDDGSMTRPDRNENETEG